MNVILSCAGTGGHIYPAIAIADQIRAEYHDARILFIGTKNGMENRLVPAAGYEIRGIDSSGFDRRNLLKNFKTVNDIFRGGKQAEAVIREFGPDLVIGTGGYVTGVVVRGAHKLGIPCYIHEQNAIPGLTNTILSRFADKVFVSFESGREKFRHPERTVLTGNPIRRDFLTLDPAVCRIRAGLADGEKQILAFGGSLGAEILNESVIQLLKVLPEQGVKLVFVTGKRYYDQIRERIAGMGEFPALRLMDYADNMPELLLASDLVISRAGAIAIAEITACGKPGIFIPSPNVANNHQYYNARAVADAGAGLMIQESEMNGEHTTLAEAVLSLLKDPEKLKDMGRAASSIGRTDAAGVILENIVPGKVKTVSGK